MIYLLLVVFAYLLGFFLLRNKRISRPQNVYVLAFMAVCGIIMGLRKVSVGVDTMSYQRFFNMVSEMDLSALFSRPYHNAVETPYLFLMKLCNMLGGNYYCFQFLISMIYCMGMGWFIKENCKSPFLGIIVFLGMQMFLQPLNITRQMLSVMLVVNGWTCLKQNRKIRATVLLVLAVCFQTSALVFFVAYGLYFFRKNGRVLRIVPLIGVLVALNYRLLIKLVSILIPKYHTYYTNTKHIQTAGGIFVVWCIIVLFAAYVIYFIKNNNGILKIEAIFCLIYVLTNIVGLSFNYFERIGFYFVPFTIVLFDQINSDLPKGKIQKLYFVGMTTCFALFFLLASQSAQYQYSFLWQ